MSPPWVRLDRILPPRPGLTRAEYRTGAEISIFSSPPSSDRIMICSVYTTTTTSNVINLINLAVDVINTNTNANMLSSKYYLLILLSFIFSQSSCPGPIQEDSHIDFRGF